MHRDSSAAVNTPSACDVPPQVGQIASAAVNTPSPYDASRSETATAVPKLPRTVSKLQPETGSETDHLDPETLNFRAYPASSKEGLPPPCVQDL